MTEPTVAEIIQIMPTFGGRKLGETGACERVIGKAYGENRSAVGFQFYDPGYRLAPNNARVMVE